MAFRPGLYQYDSSGVMIFSRFAGEFPTARFGDIVELQ